MSRVIIIATGDAIMRETVFELGKADSFGNSVKTQQATAVGYIGSSQQPSRSDHRHPTYLLATVQDVSFATSTAGIAETFSRGDHVHYGTPGAVPYGAYASNVSLSTSTGGATDIAARIDHVHYLVPGAGASNVSWDAAAAGVAASVSRSDHVHKILPGVRTNYAGVRGTSQTYTNNGSGPLWLNLSVALSLPALDGISLEVSGVSIAHADGNANSHFCLAGVINPTEQYLLTCTGGANIANWIEYGM